MTWVNEHAPRYAAAEAIDDPFVERLREQLPGADDIPEFEPFRNALSLAARDLFDFDWDDALTDPWPDAWELALEIRDAWQPLVLRYERGALRQEVAQHFGVDRYHFSDEYLHDPDAQGPYGPSQLLHEADRLSQLTRAARQLEVLLRDHAAGGTLRADQV
ncbi:hypothetical protein [Nonomuraea sp. NPDC049625]|uniref:hypothetical protein n=1 Tax=Nonomuraea sp. NPDC049625 TaxID=3155775 RepID=UPI003445C494